MQSQFSRKICGLQFSTKIHWKEYSIGFWPSISRWLQSYLEHSEHGKPDIIERRDSIVGSHPFLNTYGYVGIAGVTTNRCSFFHTFVTRISRLVFLYHLTWREKKKKTDNLGMILLLACFCLEERKKKNRKVCVPLQHV